VEKCVIHIADGSATSYTISEKKFGSPSKTICSEIQKQSY
jgi:hypothetical protein